MKCWNRCATKISIHLILKIFSRHVVTRSCKQKGSVQIARHPRTDFTNACDMQIGEVFIKLGLKYHYKSFSIPSRTTHFQITKGRVWFGHYECGHSWQRSKLCGSLWKLQSAIGKLCREKFSIKQGMCHAVYWKFDKTWTCESAQRAHPSQSPVQRRSLRGIKGEVGGGWLIRTGMRACDNLNSATSLRKPGRLFWNYSKGQNFMSSGSKWQLQHN